MAGAEPPPGGGVKPTLVLAAPLGMRRDSLP